MPRKALLFILAVGLAGAVALVQGRRPRIERIILLSVDSLRPDFLGAYDPSARCSPNIDRFARESLVFTDAIAQAPSTAPSHKSILYSLYPSVHKVDTRAQPAEAVVSPVEALRRKGYRTTAFTGGGQMRKRFGFDRGFDLYWEPERGVERTEKLREMTPQIMKWLEQHHEQRFFLFLHTYQVHCPYEPPRDLFARCCAWYKGPIDPAAKCQSFYNSVSMTAQDYRFLRDLYCAEVSVVDSFFGDLLERLRQLGIYENSLIALFSDHGESLGERGYVGHNQLHQVQLRIPLIVRVPGMSGRRLTTPVEAIDLMPAVFEAAGTAQPYPFEGRSLLELARAGGAGDPDRVRITEIHDAVAVQDAAWKGIFPLSRTQPPSLFRIADDPEEVTDLAGKHPDVLARLWASYASIREGSRELSSKFVLRPDGQAPLDETLKDELRALGYVQ